MNLHAAVMSWLPNVSVVDPFTALLIGVGLALVCGFAVQLVLRCLGHPTEHSITSGEVTAAGGLVLWGVVWVQLFVLK